MLLMSIVIHDKKFLTDQNTVPTFFHNYYSFFALKALESTKLYISFVVTAILQQFSIRDFIWTI